MATEVPEVASAQPAGAEAFFGVAGRVLAGVVILGCCRRIPLLAPSTRRPSLLGFVTEAMAAAHLDCRLCGSSSAPAWGLEMAGAP